MQKSADIVMKRLNVQKGERVLVLTDTKISEKIAHALIVSAANAGAEAMVMRTLPRSRHGEEPVLPAAKAMYWSHVTIAPTYYSITHTKAVKAATKKGARIATMPGITEDMFTRAIDIDYEALSKTVKKIKEAMNAAQSVRITTPSGTDLSLLIKGRDAKPDDGTFTKGRVGNLPAGECFVAPREGSASGILVIDHSGVCKPKTSVLVEHGRAVDVKGDGEFRAALWKYKNARNIAEFGIGANPKATLSGNVLEEEKALGTAHIAFGSNFGFGGRVKADVHWDMMLLSPTIYLDGKKIMDSGELIL